MDHIYIYTHDDRLVEIPFEASEAMVQAMAQLYKDNIYFVEQQEVSMLCNPLIQVDGYDNGLRFVCPEHDVNEPLVKDGYQVYAIGCAEISVLVELHHHQVEEMSLNDHS